MIGKNRKHVLSSLFKIQPVLEFVNPRNDSMVSAKTLTITLRILLVFKHRNIKIAVPVVKQKNIKIRLDGHVVPDLKIVQRKKFLYSAKIDISNLKEGTHTLQAVLENRFKLKRIRFILDSDPISITIDRTSPIIKNVFPSDNVKIKDNGLLKVIVTAVDNCSKIDTRRCVLKIDSEVIDTKVILNTQGIVFDVQKKIHKGKHVIWLSIFDRAGNHSDYESTFEIIPISKKEREETERNARILQTVTKLEKDKKFQKKVLTDVKGALKEIGVDYIPRKLVTYAPPIKEEMANYLINFNQPKHAKNIETIKDKIIDRLGKRDNKRLADVLKRMGKEGVLDENNRLSGATKETISKILQDPVSMMEEIGVELTETEKKLIFPAMPAEDANALTNWIAKFYANDFERENIDTKKAFELIQNKVRNDDNELVRFLTGPKEYLKELFPAVPQNILDALPQPLSYEEVQQHVAKPKYTSAAIEAQEKHNSTDCVVGISFQKLNNALDFYFKKINPGIFPISYNEDLSFPELPSPYKKVNVDIYINQPGNIKVEDAESCLISTTIGDITVKLTLEDGTQHDCLIQIRLIYSIKVMGEKVYFVYNKIEVNIELNGSILPEAAEKIEAFLDAKIKELIPEKDIPLLDKNQLEIGFPSGDTVVELEKIIVYDDREPGPYEGEMYFGIAMNDTEYLFGQYNAKSGETIAMNKKYILAQGYSPLKISAKGKELDWDIASWLDEDEDLGSVSSTHQPFTYGKFSLCAYVDVKEASWVYKVLYIIVAIIWYFVWVIVAIIDACLRLLGYETKLLKKYEETRTAVWGWVYEQKTETIKTYVLEYSISPITPIFLSMEFKEISIYNNSLYLGFDVAVPYIPDVAPKTSNNKFDTYLELGIALSENLLNKIFRALWEYYPLTRSFTTEYAKVRDGVYVSIHLSRLDINLKKDVIKLTVPLSGEAGTNDWGFHLYKSIPPKVFMDIIPEIEDTKLKIKAGNISWESGDIIDAIASFIYRLGKLFGVFAPYPIETDILLNPVMTFRVGGFDFQLKPYKNIEINDNEMILGFSVDETKEPIPLGLLSAKEETHLLFLANKDPEHKEIHELSCSRIKSILPKNYLLVFGSVQEMENIYAHKILPNEKIKKLTNQDFDGCYYCMRSLHNK